MVRQEHYFSIVINFINKLIMNPCSCYVSMPNYVNVGYSPNQMHGGMTYVNPGLQQAMIHQPGADYPVKPCADQFKIQPNQSPIYYIIHQVS